MSTGTVIALVLAVVVAAVAAILAGELIMRRVVLRRLAGPEYDRLVRELGSRRAKAEFAQRRQRVAGLGIKPLTAEQRASYTGQWTAVQERFIDSPPQSAQAAGALVTAVAADRGYPVTDHAQLLTDLSVQHGRWLDRYRRARRTTDQAEAAATEELRLALLGHRALFRDLLNGDKGRAAGWPTPGWLKPGWLKPGWPIVRWPKSGRLAAWRRVRPAAVLGRLQRIAIPRPPALRPARARESGDGEARHDDKSAQRPA